MAGADPFAIMKAIGRTHIKTIMIYILPENVTGII